VGGTLHAGLQVLRPFHRGTVAWEPPARVGVPRRDLELAVAGAGAAGKG